MHPSQWMTEFSPYSVPRQASTRKPEKLCHYYNARLDPNFVSNYTNTEILSTQASIFGVPEYAMRIWLKPDRMAELRISTSEIANAIKNQRMQGAGVPARSRERTDGRGMCWGRPARF